MNREVNLDSVLAMDAEISRLQRTRNSLLKIACIPAEILGYIFSFNIDTGDGYYFAGMEKDSYNFLFVCHHWFQVALHTPELWTSWGNDLKDWKKRSLRSGTSVLDLALDERHYCEDGSLDEDLRGALRDRAARDVVRKVHLRSRNTGLLAAIVSSLTPEDDSVRRSSIESIVLNDVDVSDLFARYHFPRLHHLHLWRCFETSFWDRLKSATTALTELSLGLTDIARPSTIPTASQIFSILSSNPNIRSLTLHELAIENDCGHDSRLQVPLRHLEEIYLFGAFRNAFPILDRLELPDKIEEGGIVFHDCTLEEVSGTIIPWIRDYLGRDARFRDRLGIFATYSSRSITLHVSVVEVVECHCPNQLPQHGPPYGTFTAMLSQQIPLDVGKQLYLDVLGLLPRECVVSFRTDLEMKEEIATMMPNLEFLHLVYPMALDGFLLPDQKGPNAGKKLFPSLRRLYLEDVEAEDDEWGPLITYLTHQTFGSGQTLSLNVFGGEVYILPEVIKEMESLVKELVYIPDPLKGCRFNRCR